MSENFNPNPHDEEQDRLEISSTGQGSASEFTRSAKPGGAQKTASSGEEPLEFSRTAGIPAPAKKTPADEPTEKTTPFPSADAKQPERPVKKLSDEELQNINQRLNAQNVASEQEMERLIKEKLAKAQNQPTGGSTEIPPKPAAQPASTPHVPSGQEPEPKPENTGPLGVNPAALSGIKAKAPVRGVAFFNGTRITLDAVETMHDGDDLIIRDHRYELRRGKKEAGKGAYALLGVALFIVGLSLGPLYDTFISGDGAIVGVALNQSGEPYGAGAVIRLPEQGISTVTDENGMFRFDGLDNGSYLIEYSLSNSFGGNATAVIDHGSVEMVKLDGARQRTVSENRQSKPISSSNPRTQRPANSRQSKSSNSSATVKTSSAAKGRGALAVTANVSGGTVYIDGQKLGETNRTFRKMRAGNNRKIRIEKTGYETYEGQVTIEPGKIAKVDVSLSKLTATDNSTTREDLDPNQLYLSARESFKSGDPNSALASLAKALDIDPGLADAYFLRGDIYQSRGDGGKAMTDYIRAGEIYSAQHRDGDALAALDNAVDATPDNKVALKVRGDFYANRGDGDNAESDYRAALEKDKAYFDARLALGIALFNAGEHRKADKELRRARDYNSKDAKLYHYLMLNSLAKHDVGAVNRYYDEFNRFATDAQKNRFQTNPRLASVREIVSD